MTALRVAVLGASTDLDLGRWGCAVVDLPDAEVAVVVGRCARPSGLPVLLLGSAALEAGADAAGVLPGSLLPPHEVRVRPGPEAGEVAARWDTGELVVRAAWPRIDEVAGDVEVLLTAAVGLERVPVATWRPSTGVGTLTLDGTPGLHASAGGGTLTFDATPGLHASAGGGTLTFDATPGLSPSAGGGTPARDATPGLHPWCAPAGLGTAVDGSATVGRLVVRLLRHALRRLDGPPVRVGMLGYGAIGAEHAAAVAVVEGLSLAAVCDPDPARIAAARTLVPEVRGHALGADLLAGDVDLVLVSTPPDTHADWVLRALEAGKHVVVEKPFCLTTEQADRQMAAAADAGLLLAVYQNRRWDPDYLALRAAVRAGRLGEVFHLESFIGGYGHPCNFWHSDAGVSGGAIYDWGSHFLDQVLDLLPQPVEWVSATAHKRVWHDVTNADHTRVLLHFAGGVEAEFTASDLAAARKPKWLVLGTEGALVGSWQQERTVHRSPVGLAVEERFDVADAPSALTLHAPDGSVTSLALPAPPSFAFHRELADALLWGAPMSVTAAGSRRTVAVMEAATRSAAEGGRPVEPR